MYPLRLLRMTKILLFIYGTFSGLKITLEYKADEMEKFVRCSTRNFQESNANRVRLYLSLDDLVVDCKLYMMAASLQENKNKMELYASVGLSLTIFMYNTTKTLTFPFNINMDELIWRVRIPRTNITISTVPSPVDEWYMEFTMFPGLAVLSTESSLLNPVKGTLLDVVREPILQWTIGEEISAQVIASHAQNIIKLKVVQSPCAGDVAVLAPIFASGGHTGVILSVTRSAFTDENRWFNVTISLCELINVSLNVSGCQGISIVDLKLTNCHLLLLTNRGLFISQDLLSPATGPLNFTLLFLPVLAQVDYSATTLWYSSQCVTNHLFYPDDYISLISNKGEGNNLGSLCLYSVYPFTKWFLCHTSAAGLQSITTYLSFLYDCYQDTGLLLSYTETDGAVVSVFGLHEGHLTNQTKLPPVQLDFKPRAIFLQADHLLVYGSEVWSSSDRGATFKLIFSLKDEMITEALCCTLTGVVVFLTNKGHIYLMKTGVDRFASLNETVQHQSLLLCDHMGILLVVSVDPEGPFALSYKTINIPKLIEGHEMGFNSVLAVQYITHQSVILHEYDHLKAPQSTSVTAQLSHFCSSHVGKIVYFKGGGEVLITEVFQTHFLGSFASAALGEILKPVRGVVISPGPMQSNNLLVLRKDPMGLSVPLQLDGLAPAQGFELAHLSKAMVATGFVDTTEAVAIPTMPSLIPASIVHQAGDWLLVSPKGEDAWGMREGQCRHILQSVNGLRRNSLIRVGVLEKINYTFKTIRTDRSFPIVYHKKFMKVVQTNPSAMKVTVKHSWDTTDNHMVTISVYNHLCKKAMTIVTVFIPEASLLCSSSSFSFTLQNSGPDGQRLIYLPLDPISDHDWLHGDPLDHMGNKRLFNLPVNYMSPVQLHVLFPTSDNIYNADPSKPRPSQHYPISKNSLQTVPGRYKQCAGKTSAKECGCTDTLRLSSLAVNSDCRQRVLRVLVPVVNVTLFLRQAHQPDQPLPSPFFVTVTEINNRTNWKVIGSLATFNMHRMRQSLKKRVYNPTGLQISCYGSELFHFRISVISDVVPCDLMEEIQIYVDDDALTFPTQYIFTMMIIALGCLLLCLFFLKYKGVTLPTKKSMTRFLRRHQSSVGHSNFVK